MPKGQNRQIFTRIFLLWKKQGDYREVADGEMSHRLSFLHIYCTAKPGVLTHAILDTKKYFWYIWPPAGKTEGMAFMNPADPKINKICV